MTGRPPIEAGADRANRTTSATRVLIAHRDEVLLATYERALADHGIEALVAASGLDCIARLRESHPELLVLEAGLLWGGAVGVLARMYTERDLPRVPVILLADVKDAEHLIDILEFPIDEFVKKPVSPADLSERISWVLNIEKMAAIFVG